MKEWLSYATTNGGFRWNIYTSEVVCNYSDSNFQVHLEEIQCTLPVYKHHYITPHSFALSFSSWECRMCSPIGSCHPLLPISLTYWPRAGLQPTEARLLCQRLHLGRGGVGESRRRPGWEGEVMVRAEMWLLTIFPSGPIGRSENSVAQSQCKAGLDRGREWFTEWKTECWKMAGLGNIDLSWLSQNLFYLLWPCGCQSIQAPMWPQFLSLSRSICRLYEQWCVNVTEAARYSNSNLKAFTFGGSLLF